MTPSSLELAARRRERVFQRLGDGVLVLPATAEARRNADVEHRYRPSSDLLYLSGFREPGAVLVLAPNAPERFTMFVLPRDPDQETWTGRRAGVEGAVETFGADDAKPIDSLDAELPKLVANHHTLWTPLGLDHGWDARIIRLLGALRAKTRTGTTVPLRIADPGPLLHELRMIKDDAELDALREAARLTVEGHLAAMRATRPGRRECELEAELYAAYRRGGGEGPGYEPIVAAGANATILHYRADRAELKAGELVLIDSGCEVESGHTADVTRTFPVDGTFTKPQRTIYELVLEAHEAAIAAVKPGTTRDAVHEVASRTLIRGLMKLGLLSGDEDELFADKSKDSYRRWFMHGTSHWLGLDVHDAGAYHLAGTPRPLAPGMVLTIEPGLYFAENDEKAPPEYRGIGVRIEDDVAVTKDGCEVLTAALPVKADEVERLVGR